LQIIAHLGLLFALYVPSGSRQPSASQSAHAVGSHLAGPHGTDHISSTQNEPDFGPGPGSGSPTSSDPAQVTSSTDASIGHVHDTSASHTAVSTNLGHPGASLSRPLDSMAGIGTACGSVQRLSLPRDSWLTTFTVTLRLHATADQQPDRPPRLSATCARQQHLQRNADGSPSRCFCRRGTL
jgi:hypothetical protein